MFASLWQDVSYSVRLLVRSPGVTGVALLTLALGIGANTAIFSIVNGVLLQPLPYPAPQDLYLIQHRDETDSTQLSTTTPGNFYDIREAAHGFRPMAAFSGAIETLTGRGEPERLQGVRSAGSILEVLGVTPHAGRIFTEADDVPGAPRTVVISHRLSQRLFSGNTAAVGQSITLAGQPHTIVGVMPSEFSFPDTRADFWAPAHFDAAMRRSRTEYFLLILGRRSAETTAGSALGELGTIMTRIRNEFPQANAGVLLDARPLHEATVTNVRPMLLIMMGSVACVLLIGCANLANLLLARATGRHREMAVRQALGAGRGRLVRQLLVESLVLAMAGGVAGALTGSLFLDALVAWLPAGIPRIESARVDGRVLFFTFLTAAGSGIAFGLAPAAQLAGGHPAAVLRANTRSSTGRAPLRSALVIAELAIALVLLTGAGLLIRSFVLMQRVDPGFGGGDILTLQVRLEGPAYENAPNRLALVHATVDSLAALPGATGAAASSYAPIVGRGTGAWFNIIGRPTAAGTTPPGVPYRVITPGYFTVMEIPILRGRALTARDGAGGTPSVVISESLARRFWRSPADGEPIGAEIWLGAPENKLFERATIVGIARDVRLAGLGSSLTDAVYGVTSLMPFWRNFTFAMKAGGDPMALASAARQIVREADPSLAVTSVQTMDDILRSSLAPTRASMLLLTVFAGLALVMAAIGVFGVMSYAVTLRSREMGIRLALGARPAEVRRTVVIDGLKQAVAGIVIGLLAAVMLTRVMDTLLFGVPPRDPLTLACVAGVLLVTALLACYLPARRATRVDPLVVLRAE
jgi:putative ABC transport system permease protein